MTDHPKIFERDFERKGWSPLHIGRIYLGGEAGRLYLSPEDGKIHMVIGEKAKDFIHFHETPVMMFGN